MGRSLFGNSVAAAQIVLAQPLGNIGSNSGQFDTNTVSTSDSGDPGGAWRMNTSYTSTNYAKPRNSVAFQHIDGNNAYFALQDELSEYTYVHGYVSTNNGSNVQYSRVYDASLNLIMSVPSSTYSGIFAVRLHESNLYFFRITNSNTLTVTKIVLPTLVTTNTSFTIPNGNNYTSNETWSLTFNWPINNKYYISLANGSSSDPSVFVFAYNLSTGTIAQEFSRYAGFANLYAMHVNPAGTDISIATINPSTGSRGVLRFNSTGVNFQDSGTSGHFQNNYSGSWASLGTSNRHRTPVTTDCIVAHEAPIYWDGYTFRQTIGHLRGGDVSVQALQYNGRPGQYDPFMQSPAVYPTLSVKNLFFLNPSLGGQGTYSIARSGSTVVFTRISSVYTQYPVTNRLSDSNIITMNSAGSWLSGIVLTDTITGATGTYTFTVNISGRNNYVQGFSEVGWWTSFVTTKGKFYNLVIYGNSSNTDANIVKGQFPVFQTATTKTYKVTVIGGGGSQSSSHGTSSAFAGIAAAAGSTRTGYVAGSTVLNSGPTRGTGGTGYGEDGWGQGEDTQSVNSYGGGSGYVSFGEVTLEANVPYFYVAGFGPQYGKQGAILLEQL